jgi:hypothetical protein
LGGRGRQISEFEASLVYKVSSRTARAIQRNPVSKKQKITKHPWKELQRQSLELRGKDGSSSSAFFFFSLESVFLCIALAVLELTL